MSTPIGVLVVLAVVAWVLVALAVAVVIGMGIAAADERPVAKPCCPHPVETAPETVRGQFRAVVVLPQQRPDRLDVKA